MAGFASRGVGHAGSVTPDVGTGSAEAQAAWARGLLPSRFRLPAHLSPGSAGGSLLKII